MTRSGWTWKPVAPVANNSAVCGSAVDIELSSNTSTRVTSSAAKWATIAIGTRSIMAGQVSGSKASAGTTRNWAFVPTGIPEIVASNSLTRTFNNLPDGSLRFE